MVDWCCSLVALHLGLSGCGWGFLTVQWWSFKRQEVEAASFLRSGPGHWHRVNFHCVLLSKLSQGPDSERGEGSHISLGGVSSHLGALQQLSDIVV